MESDNVTTILLTKIGMDISQIFALLARIGHDLSVINNEEYQAIFNLTDAELTAYTQLMSAFGEEIDKDSLS